MGPRRPGRSPTSIASLPASTRCAWCFLALSLWASSAAGGLIVPPDAGYLESIALAVCKGVVVRVAPLSWRPGWSYGVVRVEKVHKGRLDAPFIRVDFEEPDPEGFDFEGHVLRPGESVLLFLTYSSKQRGHFMLSDPVHGKFLVPALHVDYEATDPVGLLEEEFLASYDNGDLDQKVEALEQLVCLGGTRTLQHLLASTPTNDLVRGWRSYALVSLGDASQLAQACAFLELASVDPAVRGVQRRISLAIDRIDSGGAGRDGGGGPHGGDSCDREGGSVRR